MINEQDKRRAAVISGKGLGKNCQQLQKTVLKRDGMHYLMKHAKNNEMLICEVIIPHIKLPDELENRFMQIPEPGNRLNNYVQFWSGLLVQKQIAEQTGLPFAKKGFAFLAHQKS